MNRKLLTLTLFILSGISLAAAACGSPSITGMASTRAVASDASGSYSFAVCGDSRTDGIDNGVLAAILESAGARGADFIVNTGDVTTDGSIEGLERYRLLMDSSGLTFYTVPGNHDIYSLSGRQAFDEKVGPLHQGFDFGDDSFLIVNNADDLNGVDPEQMSWISGQLQKNADDRYQFIFAHIPLNTGSMLKFHQTGESGGLGYATGIQLAEEAAKHENVAAFFFGHLHGYLRYDIGGIDAYVTGGAGAPLYLPEAAGGYYHYLLVSVSDEGVEVEVVNI